MLFVFVVLYIKKPTDYISEFSLLRNLTIISIHQKVTNVNHDKDSEVSHLSETRRESYVNSGYTVENLQSSLTLNKTQDLELSGYSMESDPNGDSLRYVDRSNIRYSEKSMGLEDVSSYMGSSVDSQAQLLDNIISDKSQVQMIDMSYKSEEKLLEIKEISSPSDRNSMTFDYDQESGNYE